MKMTPDTNVLVRVLVGDDVEQSKAAGAVLKKADVVAISIPALCELVWVLSRGYETSAEDIAASIRHLISASNVVVNRALAEAGLALLDAGGDFADGVIAYEGYWLGAETFVSFDKKAVKLVEASGGLARLP
ncbi:type II toxin-antitoxin system VapC family toxin [Bradyrhizobium commune]|uniref:Type II toxin-antitoxin system VapC family toxin n=1 Tax=Bradyrhizobium commune TaxID=83627 RepID=A0A7S9GYX4_9BRAD|nr:type II toxin-antitoxin system VapC family toxin [Bradyrhizobium commune]QPF91365.1 type II toxin-antitoxin system VapC family toxin [Bradyrhizobium commune]